MCGICGIINFSQASVNESDLLKMMQIMKQRGPDDQGTFLDGSTGLGFVRLSIIDLSQAGHQPMLSSDQRYVVVFNGEIYNYIELRSELESKGHVFTTRTDTEVLLESYREWGEDCLHHFNGMWAFAIYDKTNKTLFAARDRFGVKPFYYWSDDVSFWFASDLNSLVLSKGKTAGINKQAILDYLVFNRTDQTSDTFYQQIKKLPHGNKLKIDESGIHIAKWYDLRGRLTSPFTSADEFLETMVSSTQLRLRSDVPVGICLSGGLDSSSLASILIQKFNKNDLHTFSAVYTPGEQGDESKFINLYKPLLTNMHFITPTAQSLYDDAYDFISSMGEPVPSTSPYAQYKVMELAKQNVVVTLDGQGADEQLAGYHYFFGFYFKELLQRGKLLSLSKEMLAYQMRHQSLTALKSLLFFLLPAGLRAKVRAGEHNYLQCDFASEYLQSNQVSDNLYSSKTLQDALINHFEFKLEHLLKWEDRNSMHFSLEARVPFLDYRLVEHTLATRSDLIIRGGMTKHLLRQAMQGILPEEIRLRQDKVGFDTPQDEWFRLPMWQTRIREILAQPVLHEYIDPIKAGALYDRHLARQAHIARDIWKWINLYYWLQLTETGAA